VSFVLSLISFNIPRPTAAERYTCCIRSIILVQLGRRDVPSVRGMHAPQQVGPSSCQEGTVRLVPQSQGWQVCMWNSYVMPFRLHNLDLDRQTPTVPRTSLLYSANSPLQQYYTTDPIQPLSHKPTSTDSLPWLSASSPSSLAW
jgi:hypothetical protein